VLRRGENGGGGIRDRGKKKKGRMEQFGGWMDVDCPLVFD
jgi:hypothetical protein